MQRRQPLRLPLGTIDAGSQEAAETHEEPRSDIGGRLPTGSRGGAAFSARPVDLRSQTTSIDTKGQADRSEFSQGQVSYCQELDSFRKKGSVVDCALDLTTFFLLISDLVTREIMKGHFRLFYLTATLSETKTHRTNVELGRASITEFGNCIYFINE